MGFEVTVKEAPSMTLWDHAIASALAKGEAIDTDAPSQLVVENLHAYFGRTHAVKGLSLSIAAHRITAIIGPSGCGKSTFLRCLNRMHEVVPGARREGRVLLDGEDIYAPAVDPVEVRRRVGMVFQRANPFPTMSIYDNVVVGLRLNGIRDRRVLDEVAERSLRQAALWDEVKDVLARPGTSLSGGQQQRLCIARALAVQPEVLLMDEPASALDPASTLKIEELARTLRETLTIVIVTHNMQQAARVSDSTAFMLAGSLIEYGPTAELFTRPKERQTEDYITGRFG
ncbi:MAG: phosphate ABC transporter ATP-binding protein PstB [bacterium]